MTPTRWTHTLPTTSLWLKGSFFSFLHDLLNGFTETLGDSSLDFIFAAAHSGLQCPRTMCDRNPISLISGTWRPQGHTRQSTIADEYSEDLWDFDQKPVKIQLRQLLVTRPTFPLGHGKVYWTKPQFLVSAFCSSSKARTVYISLLKKKM